MRFFIFLALIATTSSRISAQPLACNTPVQQNTMETSISGNYMPAYAAADRHYANTKGIGGMVCGGLIFLTGVGFHIASTTTSSYNGSDADHFFGTAFMIGGAITFLTGAVVHSLHSYHGEHPERVTLIGTGNQLGLAYNFK